MCIVMSCISINKMNVDNAKALFAYFPYFVENNQNMINCNYFILFYYESNILSNISGILCRGNSNKAMNGLNIQLHLTCSTDSFFHFN